MHPAKQLLQVFEAPDRQGHVNVPGLVSLMGRPEPQMSTIGSNSSTHLEHRVQMPTLGLDFRRVVVSYRVQRSLTTVL